MVPVKSAFAQPQKPSQEAHRQESVVLQESEHGSEPKGLEKLGPYILFAGREKEITLCVCMSPPSRIQEN